MSEKHVGCATQQRPRKMAGMVVLIALAVLGGSVLPGATAQTWCFPRRTDLAQQCPEPDQCCAIWGQCGKGFHYCKPGHCASGACLSAPVASPPPGGADPAPPSPDPFDLTPPPVRASPSPPPPRPRPSPPPPRPNPPPPSPRPPRPNPPPPSPRPPSPRPPSPRPRPPPPPSTTCSVIEQNTDFKGGDISGPRNGRSIQECCDICRSMSGCAAYTFVTGANICYFKAATGWNRQSAPGLQSGFVTSGSPGGNSGSRPSPPRPPPPRTGQYVFVPMTDDQKRRMYQLTSIFENASTELQYGYAERLGDNRGITYGYCGFTTGTGDGVMVAEEFERLKPGNPLSAYLPALRANANKGDRFTGLSGFENVVRSLRNDQLFIRAQRNICDMEYNEPAMEWCKKVQCKYALTKAQLHDALVNHGQGLGDRFSVDYIFIDAEKAVGGTPATGVDEVRWLNAFLAARYQLLLTWDATSRASVKRITMYQRLVEQGNLNLDGPIYIDLEKRTSSDGKPVWQIRDTYYGTFIVFDNTDPNRRLELIQ